MAIEDDPDIDAAIATSGVLNPDLTKLMRSGQFRLLDLPNAQDIAATQPFFISHLLPQGIYRSGKGRNTFTNCTYYCNNGGIGGTKKYL